MKKIVVAIIAILAYVFVADSAMAATAADVLNVTASVAASCRVTSTANVAFGAYDPTDPVDNSAGAGNFKFRCVTGTAFTMHIARTGNMTGVPVADLLAYTLYSDVGRTAPWANGVPAADPASESPAGSNAEKTRGVYGKIVALQDVAVGAYAETVTVTVTF